MLRRFGRVPRLRRSRIDKRTLTLFGKWHNGCPRQAESRPITPKTLQLVTEDRSGRGRWSPPWRRSLDGEVGRIDKRKIKRMKSAKGGTSSELGTLIGWTPKIVCAATRNSGKLGEVHYVKVDLRSKRLFCPPPSAWTRSKSSHRAPASSSALLSEGRVGACSA